MSIEVILFLLGQAVALIIAIAMSYIRTREQLIEMKVRLQQLEISHDQGLRHLRDDHGRLAERVAGISRSVARIEGGCVRARDRSDPSMN